MRLVIFHHHLRKGGVSDVIYQSIRTLLSHSVAVLEECNTPNGTSSDDKSPNTNDKNTNNKKTSSENNHTQANTHTENSTLLSHTLESIVLVSGEHPPAHSKFLELLSHPQYSQKLTLKIRPAIHYIAQALDKVHGAAHPHEHEKTLALAIKNCLLEFAESPSDPYRTLWWIHNHHLGKNPVFTHVLMDFLATTKKTIQPAMLQIHDFPEASRTNNMSKLEQEMPLSLAYHNTPHTLFCTINTADNHMLKSQHIDSYLLPNILPSHAQTPLNFFDEHTSKSFKRALVDKFPEYNIKNQHENTQQYSSLTTSSTTRDSAHDYVLLTYPVRCIRRKNALEAILIARMYEHQYHVPTKLCLTLEGSSETERPYSVAVQRLYEERSISGFFNIGNMLDQHHMDFNEVCKASDLIISPSTQEGFGFTYLNSIFWGRSLLARSIPIQKDIECIFADYWSRQWYETIEVPQNLLRILEQKTNINLYRYYREKIHTLAQFYPQELLEGVSSDLNTLLDSKNDKNSTNRDTHKSLAHTMNGTSSPVSVDFSFLHIDMQIALIHQLGFYDTHHTHITDKQSSNDKIANINTSSGANTLTDESRHCTHALTLLCQKNHQLLADMHRLITADRTKLQDQNLQEKAHKAIALMNQRYGEKAFLHNFDMLSTKVLKGQACPTPSPARASDNIKKHFLTLSHIRALYDDYS